MSWAEWGQRAACRREARWTLFLSTFDDRMQDRTRQERVAYRNLVSEAKRVCLTCPVRTECLAENLGEKTGVFGGTTGRERRQLKAKGWTARKIMAAREDSDAEGKRQDDARREGSHVA